MLFLLVLMLWAMCWLTHDNSTTNLIHQSVVLHSNPPIYILYLI